MVLRTVHSLALLCIYVCLVFSGDSRNCRPSITFRSNATQSYPIQYNPIPSDQNKMFARPSCQSSGLWSRKGQTKRFLWLGAWQLWLWWATPTFLTLLPWCLRMRTRKKCKQDGLDLSEPFILIDVAIDPCPSRPPHSNPHVTAVIWFVTVISYNHYLYNSDVL